MAQLSVSKKFSIPEFMADQAIKGIVASNETYHFMMNDSTEAIGAISSFELVGDKDGVLSDVRLTLSPCWDRKGILYILYRDSWEMTSQEILVSEISTAVHIYAKFVEVREAQIFRSGVDIFTFTFDAPNGRTRSVSVCPQDFMKILTHPEGEFFPDGAPRTKAYYGYVVDSEINEVGVPVTFILEVVENHGDYQMIMRTVPAEAIFGLFRYGVEPVDYGEHVTAKLDARRVAIAKSNAMKATPAPDAQPAAEVSAETTTPETNAV